MCDIGAVRSGEKITNHDINHSKDGVFQFITKEKKQLNIAKGINVSGTISLYVRLSSFFSAAAGAAPAGAAAAATAPPDGTDCNFSRPLVINSSMLLPDNSFTTRVRLSWTTSTPTELKIFSKSAAVGDSLPPRAANKYAAT